MSLKELLKLCSSRVLPTIELEVSNRFSRSWSLKTNKRNRRDF